MSWYLLSLLPALLLDRLIGEPPNAWHPLCWFGSSASRIERTWNSEYVTPVMRFILGLIATLLLVGTPVAILVVMLMLLPLWANVLLQMMVLYFCLGWHSLNLHAQRILLPLQQGNLTQARLALAMIVSRDTAQLGDKKIAAAATESVLENGNDAMFASLFWFMLLGAVGALAHRLINTLDAMWGYRNERFEYFGKFAARADDLVNYLPARLTALSYALVGNTRVSIACWYRQAKHHDSPNAGVVMAAGAGALGVRLGGAAMYHGTLEKRPVFGLGNAPSTHHIVASLTLIQRSIMLWLVIWGIMLMLGNMNNAAIF